MHRHLHLQHHKHTGKVLAHKHTSFWAIGLIMLLTGICVLSFQQMAYADTLSVTASVDAEPPISAAQITSPSRNTNFTDSLIQVSGTCEQVAPMTIISIYNNNNLLGSTVCSQDNSFILGIQLTEGVNLLIAKSSSITGRSGPDSSAITAILNTARTSEASKKFTMQSPNAYITFGPNLKAEWRGYFLNGKAPYKIQIDWGDGTKESFIVRDSSEQIFIHRYVRMNSYIITVTAVDASGTSIRQKFAAVTPYVATLGSESQNQPPSIAGLSNYVYIYITYVLALAVVGLSWYDLQRKKTAPVRQGATYVQPKRRRRR